MTFRRLLKGSRGEKEAEKLLRKNGYRIIERNYRCAHGEIDLVARDGEVLAFVEVKTRSTDAYGPPEAGVDRRKRRHIARVASHYIVEKESDLDARFDVVSVTERDGRFTAKLIRGAFEVQPGDLG